MGGHRGGKLAWGLLRVELGGDLALLPPNSPSTLQAGRCVPPSGFPPMLLPMLFPLPPSPHLKPGSQSLLHQVTLCSHRDPNPSPSLKASGTGERLRSQTQGHQRSEDPKKGKMRLREGTWNTISLKQSRSDAYPQTFYFILLQPV